MSIFKPNFKPNFQLIYDKITFIKVLTDEDNIRRYLEALKNTSEFPRYSREYKNQVFDTLRAMRRNQRNITYGKFVGRSAKHQLGIKLKDVLKKMVEFYDKYSSIIVIHTLTDAYILSELIKLTDSDYDTFIGNYTISQDIKNAYNALKNAEEATLYLENFKKYIEPVLIDTEISGLIKSLTFKFNDTFKQQFENIYNKMTQKYPMNQNYQDKNYNTILLQTLYYLKAYDFITEPLDAYKAHLYYLNSEKFVTIVDNIQPDFFIAIRPHLAAIENLETTKTILLEKGIVTQRDFINIIKFVLNLSLNTSGQIPKAIKRIISLSPKTEEPAEPGAREQFQISEDTKETEAGEALDPITEKDEEYKGGGGKSRKRKSRRMRTRKKKARKSKKRKVSKGISKKRNNRKNISKRRKTTRKR